MDTYGHLANEDLRAPLELLPKLTEKALPPRGGLRRVPNMCQPARGAKIEGPGTDDKSSASGPFLLERNTGFEPATFALAMRQPGIHDSWGAYTNLHDPAISLGSLDPDPDLGSTNLHADSLASCAQHVPRRKSRSRRASLDVIQVSELLGCSTAHVYDLCERSELPHYRDLKNAIRFDCRSLGRALSLTSERPTSGRSRET